MDDNYARHISLLSHKLVWSLRIVCLAAQAVKILGILTTLLKLTKIKLVWRYRMINASFYRLPVVFVVCSVLLQVFLRTVHTRAVYLVFMIRCESY